MATVAGSAGGQLLAGRKALVFGASNEYSLGWAIAQTFAAHGADVGITRRGGQGDEERRRRLASRTRNLAQRSGITFVETCDVQRDEEVHSVIGRWQELHGRIDILVHSLASARPEEIGSIPFTSTSRDGFSYALDVSAYSLIALSQTARSLMAPGSSVLALSYHGARKVVAGYGVMGVAKAALEACVRGLAVELGEQAIRVNAISAGPLRTVSAQGVSGIKDALRRFPDVAPLRRSLDPQDVAGTAVYLSSDLASAVTGEVVYVDGGLNVLGPSAGPV